MVTFEEFEKIFKPKTAAVIGVSNTPMGGGGMFLGALKDMGFPKLYPVNPNEDEVMGLKCYPSVKEIPEDVDFALISVRAKIVPQIISECVQKGVKGVAIFTAGFGEVGEEGKKLEMEIVENAGDKLIVIGPNCMGIHCPSSKLSFVPGAPKESGRVGFISQSGAHATFSIMLGHGLGINFSKVISFGNACQLEGSDFIEYLGEDPETDIIAMYVEGVKDGRRFFDILRKVAQKKPIIIWRGGVTEAGSRAAHSHTGSLAGTKIIWDSLFKQTGAIPVETSEELFDTIKTFINLPPATGRRVAIITGGGGQTVTSSDACFKAGLKVPPIDSETKKKLKDILRIPGTIPSNPVDYSAAGMNPSVVRNIIKLMASHEDIDALMVMQMVGGGMSNAMMSTSFAQQILPQFSEVSEEEFPKLMNQFIQGVLSGTIKTKKTIEKPLLSITGYGEEELETILKLQNAGIPVYPTFDRAAKAYANFVEYYEFLGKRDE
ncbi:MAG: CoA-binding protein [Halobacteriota archaeon]|nr:CoA-binding protein [Halobacteriota archaeon]